MNTWRQPTLMRRLANAYAAAPTLDTDALVHWEALAADSKVWADRIRTKLEIHYTSVAEPYVSADLMLSDIRYRVLLVSTAHSNHPVWTVEQNINFRIVHDVMGHGLSGGDFTWAGEMLACYFHKRCVSTLAALALRTECLGQVAYQQLTGCFGIQKVAVLP